MKPWWKNPPKTEKFHPRLLGRRNKKILKFIKKLGCASLTLTLKHQDTNVDIK
jgi:hypothetical protein